VAVNPRGTTKECASCGVSEEAIVGPWTFLSRVRFRGGQDANGVEHSFWRPEDIGVGTLRITVLRIAKRSDVRTRALLVNACGDCASRGYARIRKARRGTGSPTLEERTTSAVSE